MFQRDDCTKLIDITYVEVKESWKRVKYKSVWTIKDSLTSITILTEVGSGKKVNYLSSCSQVFI